MEYQKKELKLFFLLFLFVSCTNSKTSTKDASKRVHSIKNCISVINDGKEYWKNDSLGKNGYRILLVTEVLNNCRFENLKFEEIRTGLGNPRKIIENEGGIREFIYRVSHDSHLVIDVQNDSIKRFRVLTTDG